MTTTFKTPTLKTPTLKTLAGVASARLLVVAPLQIGPGAERASGAGQDQATHLVTLVVDRIERLGEATEHVHRHRVHDFLVVELEDGNKAVELQRNVLELHGFLAIMVVHCRGTRGFSRYSIFGTGLSMPEASFLL